MGAITMYSSAEARKYKSSKSVVETLDLDCKNALDTVNPLHPGILSVANRLYSMAGPFVVSSCGLSMVSMILREACNEFENTCPLHGIRMAYHEFVMVVKRELPRFFDYTVLIHLSKSNIRHLDFIGEDVIDAIPKMGCKVEVRHTPIISILTEHEMSLIMLHRVFNRDDLITLGIPSMGFRTVNKLKSTGRY